MGGLRLLKALSTAALTGLALAGATQALAATPCTLLQVQTIPASVIAPCSAIIDDPSTPPAAKGFALFIRGKAYHNSKRLDLAQQDYDAAIKLTPRNAELFVARANVAARGHRWREATDMLQQALAIEPANAHALRMAGTFTDGAQSTRYFTLALAADPIEAYALLFRSRQYRGRGQFDPALRDADALVAIVPTVVNRQGYLDEHGDRLDFHIIALQNRAQVRDARGEAQLAERDLDAAIAYRPVAQAFAARGQYLAYKRGRETDALADLDKAIALGSIDADTFYAKGIVHVRQRDFQKAQVAFDTVLSRDADNSEALLMRARMHRQLDETEHADAAPQAAIDARSETPPTQRAARYRAAAAPKEAPADSHEAIRACMLDKDCN
ncbi:hypothetical protein JQ557_13945 [Bradyrhizobium sp. U87765 SZCCT0131]|uniref:tetratricopeptide repeat protein n=1 Tax=unclassified Bradyrhizobium TaxID=2631580 RepID=UPI001BAC7528|nr:MULTISPECIES: tetratricopeptide repeat protein [unclassified Bradyrhizobium]MBR1219101.1 hypothetical protein [Bradyrhizobium sp. U87765 SZCCT0131]MBR1261752.1 hypothetical protein [Bradyrhizobium sp. U87765 SZCCT0134]MBR1306395.1 hypothetical protein [Bradyrhizobium sp. U87765 SZCCT0110]MBR1317534.1 hypothetical protein [Bradyrhizobium sp. U87765 SZCCT0109]MBR1351236.1 hypothetical protein [Bradyrhizobium sp. U87765 SZCCT0048]